ncbi:DELLA protein RGL1-like [Pyrus communis]|uniref:DELLA protein RGL1-like n=1 Tax=Pyrus communis TaxID=23211 RepID=UPI0035BFEAD7
MANAFFSFTAFDFGVLGSGGGLTPQLEEYEKEDQEFKGKLDHLVGIQELGLGEREKLSYLSKDQQHSKASYLMTDNFSFDTVCSEHDLQRSNSKSEKGRAHVSKDHDHRHYQQQNQHYQQQFKSNYFDLDNFTFDPSFPSTQPIQDAGNQLMYSQIGGSDIAETNKQMPHQSSLAALELLNCCAFKKLRADRLSNRCNEAEASSYSIRQKLSTEEIIRVAGARYVQFSNQGYGDFFMPLHPFGYALSGLSEEETKDVKLAHILLAAAEKVGYQQFERANRLLLHCEVDASFKVNNVQRVVFYFTEALRERIKKGTGNNMYKGNQMSTYSLGLGTNLSFFACCQDIPFIPVMQLPAIQVILENVALENKVHLIDLEIRSGVQWTGLMEVLAKREECHIELLTITAVGVTGKQKIEETGRRLASVAKALNLPFQFKAAIVADMEDVKDQLFDIEGDEAVVVYAPLILRTMISRPCCLENLMRVMRTLSPCVMVVIEVEANHNSPSFVNRFIDALFYYSAFFDSLETCMKQENNRVLIERLFHEGIRNIVVAEGSERVVRSVKMEVWRAFFERFRMVEINLSNVALFQASLVAKKYGSPACTLDRNGKCLTVGWKGILHKSGTLHELSITLCFLHNIL